MSCSTEVVALSRERAWGCGGSRGWGTEGLGGGALEAILRREKPGGQTHEASQAQASSFWWRDETAKGKQGGRCPAFHVISLNLTTAPPKILPFHT